jgi:hypothetical protein
LGTDVEEIQKHLEVGSNYLLAITGKGKGRKKPLSFKTPSNAIAHQIFKTVSANRKKMHDPVFIKLWEDPTKPAWVEKCRGLPQFTSASADKWFAVGWEAVMHAFDQHPEDNPKLAKLGENRVSVKGAKGGKAEASVRRSGIREELKEAMRRLAVDHLSPL